MARSALRELGKSEFQAERNSRALGGRDEVGGRQIAQNGAQLFCPSGSAPELESCEPTYLTVIVIFSETTGGLNGK